MKFYYVEISKRVGFLGFTQYKEYFISKKGQKEYIEFFNKHMFVEDEIYISNSGTCRVNARDMIVAE